VDAVSNTQYCSGVIPYEIAVASALGGDAISVERVGEYIIIVHAIGGKLGVSRRMYAPTTDVGEFLADIEDSVVKFQGKYGRSPDFISTNLNFGSNAFAGIEVRHTESSIVYTGAELSLEGFLVTSHQAVAGATSNSKLENIAAGFAIFCFLIGGGWAGWRYYQANENNKVRAGLEAEIAMVNEEITKVKAAPVEAAAAAPAQLGPQYQTHPKMIRVGWAVKVLSDAVNAAKSRNPDIKHFLVETDKDGFETVRISIFMTLPTQADIAQAVSAMTAAYPEATVTPKRSGFSIMLREQVGVISTEGAPSSPGMMIPEQGFTASAGGFPAGGFSSGQPGAFQGAAQ